MQNLKENTFSKRLNGPYFQSRFWSAGFISASSGSGCVSIQLFLCAFKDIAKTLDGFALIQKMYVKERICLIEANNCSIR